MSGALVRPVGAAWAEGAGVAHVGRDPRSDAPEIERGCLRRPPASKTRRTRIVALPVWAGRRKARTEVGWG